MDSPFTSTSTSFSSGSPPFAEFPARNTHKSRLVFRTAPSGNLFEDRTLSRCPCNSADLDHSLRTICISTASSSTPPVPWTPTQQDFVFELSTSADFRQDLIHSPGDTDEWRRGSAPHENGLAHLSGAFSTVNLGNQLKPKPFKETGIVRRRHSHVEQIHTPLSPRSSSHPAPSSLSATTADADKKITDSTRLRDPRGKAKRTGGIVEQLMSGAFAGVVSRTATAPIDLVRTHLISSHALEGSSKAALSVLQGIMKKDGWVGLFRGNGINCLRVAPCKAIELCTFQMLKCTLCTPGHPLHRVAAPLSGGAAGMAGAIATYPLEVMRTRISVQPERYANLASTFSTMVREEGFWSIYRGLPMTLFGVFPYAAANYCVYDTLRGLYRKATGKEKVPTEATLLFGAVAASVSSAVTFPLEVARRRMQLGTIAGKAAPTSGLQVIREIAQKEGWRAVYRGLGTTWLKLIPAAGISFVCYEAARYALRVDDASVAAAKLDSPSGSSTAVEVRGGGSHGEEGWERGKEPRGRKAPGQEQSFRKATGSSLKKMDSAVVVGLGPMGGLQRTQRGSETGSWQSSLQRKAASMAKEEFQPSLRTLKLLNLDMEGNCSLSSLRSPSPLQELGLRLVEEASSRNLTESSRKR